MRSAVIHGEVHFQAVTYENLHNDPSEHGLVLELAFKPVQVRRHFKCNRPPFLT